MAQIQGVLGLMVDRMIRRTVRRTFRGVFWQKPLLPVSEPTIFVANHHGWHDGYLMYLALSRLQLSGFSDWIAEYDQFPLFGKIGGMPFPSDDAARRAATIRHTIRLMKRDHRSLLLFAEGILHRPPELLPFGKSLELLVKHVPNSVVVPVAIKYEHSMHERSEAFIKFGGPVEKGPDLARRTRLEVAKQLDRIAVDQSVAPEQFEVLFQGTKDVNERFDIRQMPGFLHLNKKLSEFRDNPPRND